MAIFFQNNFAWILSNNSTLRSDWKKMTKSLFLSVQRSTCWHCCPYLFKNFDFLAERYSTVCSVFSSGYIKVKSIKKKNLHNWHGLSNWPLFSYWFVPSNQKKKSKDISGFFFFVVPHACRERDHVHACHTCTIHVTSISADRKQRSCFSCSASCECPAGFRSLHVAHRKLFSSWQRGRRWGGGGGGVGTTKQDN